MPHFEINQIIKIFNRKEVWCTGIGSADYFDLQKQFHNSLMLSYNQSIENKEFIRHAVDGSIKLMDACALRDILQITRPKRAIEVGSFLGFSLRWMLDSTKLIGTTFTSVDPRVRHRIFDDIKSHLTNFNKSHADRINLIDAFLSEKNEEIFLHDYLNYEPKLKQDEAISLIEKIELLNRPFGEFDFAFIDGDHSYAATIKNVSLVAQMMPSGGYIVVHDAISWPDVEPALSALCEIDGIDFVGIFGKDFFQWVREHHILSQNLDALKFLCDGLGVIKIDREAKIYADQIEDLLFRQHNYAHP